MVIYVGLNNTCSTIIYPYPPIWSDNMACTASSTSIFPTWHNNIAIYLPYIDQTASCNTATICSNTIFWPDWQDNITIPNIIQERMEAENARMAELARVRLEEIEKNRLSSEKAKQILLDHLTPEQRDTVEKNGWFVIEGGITGKRYKIKSGGVAGNIEELDDNGKMIAKYCCHLSHVFPQSDHHLAQKLMLEWNESEFLRLANKTLVG